MVYKTRMSGLTELWTWGARRKGAIVIWTATIFMLYQLGARWRVSVPQPNNFFEPSQSLHEVHPMLSDLSRYFDDWGSMDFFSFQNSPKKLLLVTHYRGGSTFLGDLFGQSGDCFYWFEPLRPFLPAFNYLTVRVNPSIIEGTHYKLEDETLMPLPDNLTDPRVETLIQVMTCDVRHLDARVVDDTRVDAFHSPLAKNYSNCRHSGGEVMNCRQFMEDSCRHSQINVAKTVRIPFYLVPKLLAAVPDLDIIYYTRDPRAIMHSRIESQAQQMAQGPPRPGGDPRKKPVGPPKEVIAQDARNLCLRMMDDHMAYLATDAAYPGRILHVVYEDLAFNPVEVTTRMYRFMGMELPAAIETWIEDNTKAEKSDKNVMSTHKNSTWTATRWLSEVDPDLIEELTIQCQEALDMLEYPLYV